MNEPILEPELEGVSDQALALIDHTTSLTAQLHRGEPLTAAATAICNRAQQLLATAQQVDDTRRADTDTAPGAREPITLISFGYLHCPTDSEGRPIPPEADRVEDVRHRLRDPAAARAILNLDGFHPRVQEVVLSTPGARDLINNLVQYATSFTPRSIAIGCAGGRHRACSLIEILGRELQLRGQSVEIDHQHAHLPRVLKTPAS